MGRRWLLLPLILILLSGCWSRVEINDLGLVLGMAIDVGEEHRGRLTLYLVRAGAGGSGAEATADGVPPIWVVAREADSLADALREISLASPRRISLQHLRVVLIGEEFARTDIRGVLDFLARHPQIRLSVRPMMVRGRAQTVLETLPLMRTNQPENLTSILQAKGGVDWRLLDFLVARASATHSAWMYAVGVIDRPAALPGSPTTAVVLQGAALFKGDHLQTLLDSRETQVLNWLLGNPRESVVTANCPHETETFSVRVERGRAYIEPQLGPRGLHLQVRATGKVGVVRLGCVTPLTDRERLTELEQALEKDLEERLRSAIDHFQESGVDPVGFGKRVQLKYPGYWRQVEQRFPEIWPTLSYSVEADLTITESGLLISPATETEEQLEELGAE